MIIEEEAKKKVSEGWIDAWIIFEALAISEDVSRQSLESLVNKMDKDARVKVYKKSFGENKKVEKPMEGIEFGYSLTCEVNVISKNVETLANVVIEYGPSAVEIQNPQKINMTCGEAQNILNSISSMMHRLASVGAGGIVFMKGDE